MKQAIAYLRVSTDRQAEKDLSLPSQLAAIRKFAADQGFEIARVFEDAGESARTADRPAFKRAIDYCLETPGVKAFLCYDTSRFARNREDAVVMKGVLHRRGVKVLYASQQISQDDEGGFLQEAILEVIDEYYSRALSRVTLRGMIENARRGYANGGNAPFGFRFVAVKDEAGNPKARLEIDPAEGPTVERMFRLHGEGLGGKAIAQALSADGLRTRRGGVWTSHGILGILRNSRNAGIAIFNRRGWRRRQNMKAREEWVTVPGANPAIIDEAAWRAAQERLDARTCAGLPAVRGRGLLSGLLRCGLCGAALQLETGKGRSSRHAYYGCRSNRRAGKQGCPGVRVRMADFDREILRVVTDVLLTPESVRRMVATYNRIELRRANGGSERVRRLEQEIGTLAGQVARLVRAIETGRGDPGPLMDRIEELRAAQRDREAALVEARRPRVRLEWSEARVRGLRERVREMLQEEPAGAAARDLARKMVQGIAVWPDRAHVDWKRAERPQVAFPRKGGRLGPAWLPKRAWRPPGRPGRAFRGTFGAAIYAGFAVLPSEVFESAHEVGRCWAIGVRREAE